jgi:hypothetical protein
MFRPLPTGFPSYGGEICNQSTQSGHMFAAENFLKLSPKIREILKTFKFTQRWEGNLWITWLYPKTRARERGYKTSAKIYSAERKRKKREFALFLCTPLEAQFQSPKLLGRGKASLVSIILRALFYNKKTERNIGQETGEREKTEYRGGGGRVRTGEIERRESAVKDRWTNEEGARGEDIGREDIERR